MDLTTQLSDAHLQQRYGVPTLQRAESYVDRAIESFEVQEDRSGSLVVYADVRGSERWPYEVTLIIDPANPTGIVISDCTCPVGYDCKHGAAVALALREAARPGAEQTSAAWRQSLAAVTTELVQRSRVIEQHPMALQFSLQRRPRHYYASRGPQLCLRPLRPGAKQRWIKTGAEWASVPGLVATHRIVPEQAEVLDALHFALQRSSGFINTGPEPLLAQFGPKLAGLLRDAAEAGIEFVTLKPLTSVTVAKEPATVIADLTTEADHALVRVAIDAGDQTWHGEALQLHGADAAIATHLTEHGELGITDLATPMTPSLNRLATGEPLRVPHRERDDLLEQLSGLTRHLELRSSDGSIEPPTRVLPVLTLTVTWHSAADAALEWRWRYGTQHCPLASPDPLGGLRDPEREAAVRRLVPGEVLGRQALRGGDALAFALHTLPHLNEIDGLEVTELQRPEFRESTEAPDINFDLAESAEPAAGDDHTDWLDLEVTVRVDGEEIGLPEVLEALTDDEPFLILPSGLFIATDRPEFDKLRAVVAAAAELRERDGDRLSVGKHDLGVWAQLAETGIVDAQAAEWVRRAQALRDLVDIPRPEPRGLTATLRPYQLEGFWWLSFLQQHGLGGILADDMGLGKTLQVLAMIQLAVADPDRSVTRPFLVVAPTSVVTAWRSEAAQHAPGLRVGVIERRSDDVAAIAAESDLVVTTYTLLRLDGARYAELAWDGLVLDEAQQVKNHQSKTYAAVRRIEAPFRLAVTGTPFENRLMELWSLLSIAVPGLYPAPKKFRDDVVRPVERAGSTDALRRFQGRVKPFLLRRTKELVADDLPPKQEQVLSVDLNPRHRKLYDAHLAKERQRILGLIDDFDSNRVAIFAALTKLRQLALDPALVDERHDRVGSAKIDVLADHLAEITSEGHQALVFSQFTSFLGRVRTRLAEAGIRTAYLDGATRDRGAVIDDFRAGAADVFLISLKAGGVGLTLTEADYVFVLDPWWNPAAEAQAVDRAHRIGQRRHVNVYRLVATETIEEKVMTLKERKAELFARVIDTEGALATGIDADDLRGIFEE